MKTMAEYIDCSYGKKERRCRGITPQKAIVAIKIKEIEISGNALRIAEFFQGISVATQALEKQIPKKPIEDRYPWAICPTCGGSVYLRNVQEHIHSKENTYCEHCGQALDWSDTE